jgi:hypothetical protein
VADRGGRSWLSSGGGLVLALVVGARLLTITANLHRTPARMCAYDSHWYGAQKLWTMAARHSSSWVGTGANDRANYIGPCVGAM